MNAETDDDAMELALDQARQALEHDDVPVGAIVVSPDRAVVAARHNGGFLDFGSSPGGDKDMSNSPWPGSNLGNGARTVVMQVEDWAQSSPHRHAGPRTPSPG